MGPKTNAERCAIVDRLKRRTVGAGSFSGPCLPALLEHYMSKVAALFELLDRPLTREELTNFRAALQDRLEQGFEASPYARFVLAYQPSATNPLLVDCSISIVAPSLGEQYEEWLRTTAGEQPFGKHADAKVLDVARTLASESGARALDVGAGTGRNALALARLGFGVDAIEPVSELANGLRVAAIDAELPVSVAEHDVLADDVELPEARYALIVLSEVTPHFSRLETASVLAKLSRALVPGGTLLFNAFLTRAGYEPDELAYQAAQTVWSTFFTPRELAAVTEPLGLVLASEAPCLEYERARAAASEWPPTPWYENWASGYNLFSVRIGGAPIELRWREYQKSR